MSPRSEKFRSALLLSAFSLGLVLTQSGCPEGAELENQDAWAGRFGAAGTTSTGATGGSAMGGTAGSGTAGGGMAGTGTAGPVLDFTTVMCPTGLDPTSFLTSTCAKNFCHGNHFVAGLDLRPDSGFAARLLDVAATHGDITCADLSVCVPPGCPPAGMVKLVDSSNPTASWILAKAHDMQGECGDRMPSTALSSDQDTCLTAIVNATAALKK